MSDQDTTERTAEVGLFEGIGLDPQLFAQTLAKQEANLIEWQKTHRERIRQKLQSELACSQ